MNIEGRSTTIPSHFTSPGHLPAQQTITTAQESKRKEDDYVLQEVKLLYQKLYQYILHPGVHPNPLRKISKRLDNVILDTKTWRFTYQESSYFKSKKQPHVKFSNYSQYIETCSGMLAVIKEVAACFLNGGRINKREIYYKHVTFFESQTVVDSLISRFTFLLKLPRKFLRIVSIPFILVYFCDFSLFRLKRNQKAYSSFV